MVFELTTHYHIASDNADKHKIFVAFNREAWRYRRITYVIVGSHSGTS